MADRPRPPWHDWPDSKLVAYRDQTVAYLADTPSWIAGPAVVTVIEHELARRHAR